MKLPAGPIEAKVAASGVTGGTVTLVLQLLAAYVPGFHAPPAATTALLVTVLTAIAGWLAPHTPRGVPTVRPPGYRGPVNSPPVTTTTAATQPGPVKITSPDSPPAPKGTTS